MVLINRSGKGIVIWGQIWIALTFLLLFGCATTKPNRSIVDPDYTPPKESETNENFSTAKEILTEISLKNHLLAIELGKLPELQDGVSTSEKKALATLHHLYKDDPKTFDEAFAQMYRVGLPDVRKYCSPLQALFWLAKTEKFGSKNNPLVDYSLKKILDEVWIYNSPTTLSEEEIQEILQGIKDETMRELYRQEALRLNNLVTHRWYWACTRKPGSFSWKARKIIQRAYESDSDPRWRDFHVVVDRLNAPELIDYYERKRFRYHYEPDHGGDFQEVVYVFKHNKGHCLQISAFTEYCLKRSGYSARILIIVHPKYRSPRGNDHRVCLFEVDGRKYVMDNGRRLPYGIVPYSKYNIEMRYSPYFEEVWNEFQ